MILNKVNAYILTGGSSRRFGSDKALAQIEELTFLDKIYAVVQPFFHQVYSVGKISYSTNIKFIPDGYKQQAPLVGILTALKHSSNNWNLILSVDIPFINQDVLQVMIERLNENQDSKIIIPHINDHFMPMLAFYHKDCIFEFERALKKNNFTIKSIINYMNPVIINMNQFRDELANINTIKQLHKMSRKMSTKREIELQ